jgi:hypothetical protein
MGACSFWFSRGSLATKHNELAEIVSVENRFCGMLSRVTSDPLVAAFPGGCPLRFEGKKGGGTMWQPSNSPLSRDLPPIPLPLPGASASASCQNGPRLNSDEVYRSCHFSRFQRFMWCYHPYQRLKISEYSNSMRRFS